MTEPARQTPAVESHPGRGRRASRPGRPPHPWAGLHAYVLIGAVCLIGLNLASYLSGGPTVLSAFAAGLFNSTGLRLLLDWGIGPFLLWPLWLPLATLHFLRDLFT